MAASNMLDPFLANIVVVFSGNTWQTNAVNNSITFQGTKNSTFKFINAPNAPVILDEQIGVTFTIAGKSFGTGCFSYYTSVQ